MRNSFSFRKIISSSAAGVVLVCFFLPWITVSCEEQELFTLSGWDMSTGTEVDLGFGTEQVEPDLIFFIIPLAAFVVLGLVLSLASWCWPTNISKPCATPTSSL